MHFLREIPTPGFASVRTSRQILTPSFHLYVFSKRDPKMPVYLWDVCIPVACCLYTCRMPILLDVGQWAQMGLRPNCANGPNRSQAQLGQWEAVLDPTGPMGPTGPRPNWANGPNGY